jgi:hypothetical protein
MFSIQPNEGWIGRGRDRCSNGESLPGLIGGETR